LRQIDFACGEEGIDWQIWLAAMASPAEYTGTLHFVWKLLKNEIRADSRLRLVAENAEFRRLLAAMDRLD